MAQWSALAGQVAIGFVPLAGQAADIWDLVAAGKAVAEGKENAGWQFLFAAVGVVPGLGDVLKGAGKVALGGAAMGRTCSRGRGWRGAAVARVIEATVGALHGVEDGLDNLRFVLTDEVEPPERLRLHALEELVFQTGGHLTWRWEVA